MPAPKFLSGLPKPALFGLYGAVGGLLGALVFGELIMLVLSPKKADAATSQPRLAMVASGELQVYQGGTNKFFVQILRDQFEGEVTIHAEGLPSGVKVPEVVIPPKQDQAVVELRATFRADVVTSADVKIVATAEPKGKEVRTTAPLKLSVLPSQAPQADIVFVLDVTGSMQGQINGLKSGIETFARDLYEAKVDARFGCVAFRDLEVREPNVPLRFQGESFTSDAETFRAEIAKLRASGGGESLPESSFEAISDAAKYDFRKSAIKTLVLITDAEPNIVLQKGQSKEATIKSLRDNSIDFLHLVVHQPHVRIYSEIQQGALGSGGDKANADRGKVFNILTVANDPTAMTTKLLPELTTAILAAAEAKRPEEKLDLAKQPDAKLLKGVQSSESYARSDAIWLVLAVGVWTGAIAALVCLFLLSGQHHYLRGTLPAVGGILAALGGGLLVGIIGGAAGQGLFFLADTGNQVVIALFRIMGWTILGSLAGLGLSFFIPNLKLVYGLGGGAIGGAVGAIGYIVTESIAGALLGRLAGGLALGFFIGLMVAVVEAAFRRAWLEVRYGPREVVTVNLGTEPVKVGSDAQACTVWARGAANIALRYFIRDGKVVCTDVPARIERVVNDGDAQEVGNVTVVVRTGAGTASASESDSRRAAPPAVLRVKSAPKSEPLDLPPLLELGNDDDGLPMPVSAPPPSSSRPAPVPARPPAPTAASVPPRPAAQPAVPINKPATAPKAKDPDACPTCGRKNAGRPGSRYCMVCDQSY